MIVQFLVAALACWRITNMLLREDGPLGLFEKYRTFMGRYPKLAPLAYCVYCLSVWVGLVAAALAFSPAWPLLAPFALSAVTIGMESRVSELDR